ncbi:MAG: 3-methyl-2-oxobutanoate dehydrogenase subunit beta, partial [Bacteroidota bacterium]
LIGQMMEKVELFESVPRTNEFDQSWVITGKTPDRERNIVTSLNLDPAEQEIHNQKLIKKYNTIKEKEVRFEKIACDDAEYLLVAYGSSARICQKAVQLAREKNIRAGLLRPMTLFPFPGKEIADLSGKVKGILSVELSTGQMVEDVKLAVEGKVKVEHFGRFGGMIHSPEEVVKALEQKIIGG